MSYKIYRIGFKNADSFYLGYTSKNINKTVNEILFKSYFLKKKEMPNPEYGKLYNFIEKIGIDNILIDVVETINVKHLCEKYINSKNPPLN